MVVHRSDAIIYTLERADLGVRHDIVMDAALALYMNRSYYVEYLVEVVGQAKQPNKLQLALITQLQSLEIIAALRAHAIFCDKVIEPLRMLTNSNDLGLCAVHMGVVYDRLLDALDSETVVEDMMDPKHRIFSSDFLDTIHMSVNSEAQGDECAIPLSNIYDRWKERKLMKVALHTNRKSEIRPNWIAFNEMYDPQDETNQATTPTTRKLIVGLSGGLVEGLRNNPSSRFLSSCEGIYSQSHIKDIVKQQLSQAVTTNDISERIFAITTANMKKFQGADTAEIAYASMLQQNGFLAPGPDGAPSLARQLPPEVLSSMLATSRSQRSVCRSEASEVLTKMYENTVIRLDTAARKEKQKLKDKALRAMRYFNRRSELVHTRSEVHEKLSQLPSEGKKKEFLQDQIRIRRDGLSWPQCSVPFSSSKDDYIGSVDHLTKELGIIIDRAIAQPGEYVIPEESPLPTLRNNLQIDYPRVGTLTPQAARYLRSAILDAEHLREEVANQYKQDFGPDTYQVEQPQQPPVLVEGTRIEVNFRFEEMNDKGKMVDFKWWLPGRIEEVQQTQPSKTQRRRNQCLYTIKYCTNEVEVRTLTDATFNGTRVRSWRIDLDYYLADDLEFQHPLEPAAEDDVDGRFQRELNAAHASTVTAAAAAAET